MGNHKDKDPKTKQTGVIYQYQCPHIHCSSCYIGESGRSLGDRVKEHLKAPSPIHLHSAITGHPLDPNQFNIMHKEVHSQSQNYKGSNVHLCSRPPSTATYANTNYHTFGTNFFSLHQSSSTSQHNSQLPLPTLNPPYWLPPHLFPSLTHPSSRYPFKQGASYFFLYYPLW